MWPYSTTFMGSATMAGFTPDWVKFTLLVFLLLIIVSMRICIQMAWRIMRRSRREAHYASLLASLVTLYVGTLFVGQYFPRFNIPKLLEQAQQLWFMLG